MAVQQGYSSYATRSEKALRVVVRDVLHKACVGEKICRRGL